MTTANGTNGNMKAEDVFKAYVKHGTAPEPCRDEKVPYQSRTAPVNRSRTGYGSKIPTEHMVHYNGRWRRVYAICYSNVATLYILASDNSKLIVNLY